MRRPAKASKMIDYIEEQLISGAYSAGSRIPSIRRLSTKFGLTYSTALRGVDYLCSSGVLEKSAKRGIYVKLSSQEVVGDKKNKEIVILLTQFIAEKSSGIYYTALHGIQNLAIQKQYPLKIIPTSIKPRQKISNLQEICGQHSGVILLHEYDHEIADNAVNLPAVGVLMHNNLGGRISNIDIDPFNAAEIAVEYFKRYGKKKVMVVTNCFKNCKLQNTYINRGKIFAEHWRDAGFELSGFHVNDPYNFIPIEFSSDRGYLFTSDSLLQKFSKYFFDETGVELAHQHTVLGIDGKNLIDPDFHKFPSISIDWKIAGRYALEECIYRLNNPGSLARRIYLSCSLKVP